MLSGVKRFFPRVASPAKGTEPYFAGNCVVVYYLNCDLSAAWLGQPLNMLFHVTRIRYNQIIKIK